MTELSGAEKLAPATSAHSAQFDGLYAQGSQQMTSTHPNASETS